MTIEQGAIRLPSELENIMLIEARELIRGYYENH